MKLAVTVTILFACAALSSAAFLPLSLGPFPTLTEIDSADLAYLRQQYARPKRAGSGSGSGDVLNTLKASIGQGLKSKLGMIGKASSGHYYPQEDHKPPFDVWSFKKSLLYTLLQAVKAIKGGVIAIKGQLIKGGGQLLATKGTIIKGGGEALSNLGKSIASSAFMIVPQSHDDYEEHYEHVPPTSYGHSGPGPEVHHSGPSGPGPEYGPPGYHQKYNSVYDGKHEHDGIVILKKIPHGHGHGHGHGQGEHEGQETIKTETEFKPLKDDSYSGVRHIMGQVFSASSSSTPDQPPHKPKHYEYPPQKQHDTQAQPQKEFEYPPVAYPPPPQKQYEKYPPQKQYEKYPPQKQYEKYPPQTQYEQYPPQKQYEQSPPAKQYDQERSPDIPATSYGVPDSPRVKYPEYYVAPANTINQNKPQMFVTPSPPTETEVPITYKLEIPKITQQKENSQIFIGMNVPMEYPKQEISQDYLTEFKLAPTPYSQQIPTQFLINYPDPTEFSLLRNSFAQQSRHAPKKLPRPPKFGKKSPNLDILRSVSFELRPDGRPPLKF